MNRSTSPRPTTTEILPLVATLVGIGLLILIGLPVT